MRILMMVGFIVVGVLPHSVQSADLGYISLGNREQARLAQQQLGHGLIRLDNRYLVSASAEQQTKLTLAGIAFESIKADVDLSVYHVVYPSKQASELPKSATLTSAMPLDNDLQLVEGTASQAQSWRRDYGLKVRPLAELSVPFVFEGVTVGFAPALLAPPSDTVANRVQQDSVYGFDARLQAFYTRYAYTDSVNKARDWLVQRFLNWGYTDVTTPYFTIGGYPGYNVKAVKLGTSEPDKVIVVGGHYDSYSSTAMTHAPGADDNGSGTSMVLELARVLRDIPLRKTVIFMPFSGEEEGLYGSEDAAADFRAAGTDVEVMYNADMIGYSPDATWNTDLESGSNTAYRDLFAQTGTRVSNIGPTNAPLQGNSDHYPFNQQGFNIVMAIEGDFNTPNYHRPSDSTTKLNFAYMTGIVKTFAASVAYVADAGSPTGIDSIVDQGDGQALTVFLNNCRSDYQYVVYRGTTSGIYNDSAVVTPGTCTQTFNGLTQGIRYYFAVKGTPSGGYPPVYMEESSEIPQLYPRVPAQVVAEPMVGSVQLSWASNHEADLDHYDLYRKGEFEGDFTLLAGGLTQTAYTDNAVVHWVTYQYKLKAVDQSGYESAFSAAVVGTPATFDHGILIADEMTEEYDFMPSQPELEAWYDTVLSGAPHGLVTVDDYADALKRPLAGQYSSIWWIDDDIGTKLLRYSRDTLRWYSGFTNDMLIAGYQTIPLFTPAPSPGHLLYDEFMLQSYALNYAKDFAGAKGVGGWPSVELDTTRGIKRMGDIPSLTPRAGATIIYQYDSNIDDPGRENTPVGIAYDGPRGKRVLLSFPLWYMTPGSVQALMSAVKSYFGETGQAPAGGDLDGSGFVDIGDLVALVDFIFFGVPVPNGPASADTDGSCVVDITDLQRLIDYLFFNYAAPVPGCAR
ncbi:MAG: M28 family peptidase [Candidatus Zixiibacteriota bacterium]